MDPVISIALRIGFALLFAVALLHKLSSLREFERTVANYLGWNRDQNAVGIRFIAIAIVLLEGAAAVSCLLQDGIIQALVVAMLLLTYAAAMFLNLRRGNVLLDCGCTWGRTRQPVSYRLVARNVLLSLIALGLVVPVETRTVSALDMISVAAITVVASALYAAANLLLTLGTSAVGGQS